MFSSVRFKLLTVSGWIALMAFLLAACSKLNEDSNNNTPAAGLMSFNLAVDQPGIGISLSGNNLLNFPLAYTNYSGTYQLVFPGNRQVESFNAASDSSLAAGDFNFEANKYYSLFVTGDNGNYSNIIAHDNFDSLVKTAGKAHIRYINAIADSSKPVVSIAANGTSAFNGSASFNDVSDFRIIDAGNADISASNSGTINAVRSISLEEGKVYTVLLTGKPGATDSARKVQVKYITNGSLTSNQ